MERRERGGGEEGGKEEERRGRGGREEGGKEGEKEGVEEGERKGEKKGRGKEPSVAISSPVQSSRDIIFQKLI